MKTKTGIRSLDIDDLLTIIMISKGLKQVEISERLGISPPAVRNRITKHLKAFPGLYIKNRSGKILVSESGLGIVNKCDRCIDTLMEGKGGIFR